MADTENLSDIVRTLPRSGDGEEVAVGDVVDTLEGRSIGPLLLVPSLLSIIPIIGSIPGMAMLSGTMTLLVSMQFFIPQRHLWLPRRLRRMAISRDRLKTAVDRMLPWIERSERVLNTRLVWLVDRPGLYAVAAVCVLMGLIMFPAELVPSSVVLPAGSVLFMAAGLIARDGVAVLAGYGLAALAIGILWSFVPGL